MRQKIFFNATHETVASVGDRHQHQSMTINCIITPNASFTGGGVSFGCRGALVCFLGWRVLPTGRWRPSLPLQRGRSAEASRVPSEPLPWPRIVSVPLTHTRMSHVTTQLQSQRFLFDHRMEFTKMKLRRSGNYQGLYMLRCSPKEYDKYFMSFIVGVSTASISDAIHKIQIFNP